MVSGQWLELRFEASVASTKPLCRQSAIVKNRDIGYDERMFVVCQMCCCISQQKSRKRAMSNLLLSCAGRRVELMAILETALLETGQDGMVVAADAQPFAPAFISASARALVPRVSDPTFVDRMLDVCAKQDVRWVILTIDTELPILSLARARFEAAGVDVMVSGPKTIAIAADKRATHAWFVENGFPTFCQVSVAQALADPDWIYPCFAKPACGSRSIGAKRILSRQMLMELPEPENMVVETLGHGVEVTVDCYISPRTGKCACVVPRQRLEVRDGEVSKGKTIDPPGMVDLVRRVAEALPDARGVICVQMFYDRTTEEMCLMEINPRFGGGYPLTEKAGATFAKWYLEDTLGLPSTIHENWTRGLVMLRYDSAVYIRG